MLSKTKERYIESGGDFRDLTSEEGLRLEDLLPQLFNR